jgi:hypothetical protein
MVDIVSVVIMMILTKAKVCYKLVQIWNFELKMKDENEIGDDFRGNHFVRTSSLSVVCFFTAPVAATTGVIHGLGRHLPCRFG